MDIPPIRTRQDDATALKVASTLVDAHPTPGTAESDELDVLSILIERYEAHHFPLKAPTRSKRSNSAWNRPACAKPPTR